MIGALRALWLLGLAIAGGSQSPTGAAIGLGVLLLATAALHRRGDL